jgi:peptidoglycan hydrolase CwlO-like protein
MIKDKTFKFQASHLIMGAIILLLLFFVFLKPKKYDFSKVDKQQRKVDSLSYVIKNLQREQTVLNNSISYHQNKIDLLDSKIFNTNQEIIDIRKDYGKQIQDINNFTPSQLNDFFAKRYK